MFFLLIAVSVAAIVMATTNWPTNSNEAMGKDSPTSVSQMPKCPSCGGDMTTSFKTLFDWKVCPSCHGKGYIQNGKQREQCNFCKDSGRPGYYKQYVPARVCKSCSYSQRI